MTDEQSVESGTDELEESKVPPPPDFELFDPKTGMVGLIPFFETGRPMCSLPLEPDRKNLMLVSQVAVNQAADDARFDKFVTSGLGLLRVGGGTGLFTADTSDPDWALAHKLLMPAFSSQAIKGYHEAMCDPASQLMLKWARLNPGESVDVTADFTRLTFETIGLVGFGHRFAAFYSQEPHPFVIGMGDVLHWAIKNANNPEASPEDPPPEIREAVDFLNETVDSVIRERQANPRESAGQDLLDYMLSASDPKTGESLSVENIRQQINTFLIAGHETTSGLLSFVVFYLMNNPDVLQRCYEEVDRELGSDLDTLPTADEISSLRYVMQVLKETLRLWPGAPFIIRRSREDIEVLDEYPVTPEDCLHISLASLHRDQAIWGDNPNEFDPDRFTPESEAELPENAYLPFGIGQRACIGRQFSIAEAQLALGMLLQRFEFVDYENYDLQIRRGLTIKPKNFRIKVLPRKGREAAVLHSSGSSSEPATREVKREPTTTPVPPNGKKVMVLFGSNLGTSENLAREISADAARSGFDVDMAPLDDRVADLDREAALVVVTSSYNGQPPDNAVDFCKWLHDLEPDALDGLQYAVFGCGDRNWSSTFQAIPRRINAELAEHGAEEFSSLGAGDASDDFDGQFRKWYAQMWPNLYRAVGLDPDSIQETSGRLELEVGIPLRQRFFATLEAKPATLVSSEELQGRSRDGTPDRSTRLIQLELPEGETYETGDHLAVLPYNTPEALSRALTYFEASPETIVSLHADGPSETSLPLDQPHTLGTLLNYYSELQRPATRAQIAILSSYATAPRDRRRLESMIGDDEDAQAAYREFILNQRRSVIDLLEENPSCRPPDEVLLDLLGELKPRFYSIASSPLAHPSRVALMVGVLESPSFSGHGTYRGTCSTFLSRLPIGQKVHVSVRSPGMPFRPPADFNKPMIMIATGAGLAPFRGFLQERAADAQHAAIAESMLFFGCRNSGADFLIGDDLERYDADGVVDLVMAYSDEPGFRRKFVQDRIRDKAAKVWELMERGANVYVCGHAGRVAPAARKVFEDIYAHKTGASKTDAERWLQDLRDNDRYLEDIWAGN